MNNVNIIGRIASDVLKFNIKEFNKDVVKFAIAVDNRTRKTDGRKDTFFFECEAWDVVAQRIYENVDKGSKVGITGHLEQAKFTKKDGSKGSLVKIVVSGIEFLSDKPKTPADLQENALEEQQEEMNEPNFDDDKLPF